MHCLLHCPLCPPPQWWLSSLPLLQCSGNYIHLFISDSPPTLLHTLWAACKGTQGSFGEPLPCPGVSEGTWGGLLPQCLAREGWGEMWAVGIVRFPVRFPSPQHTSVMRWLIVMKSTTHTKANTVMRGVWIIIPQVMQVTLLSAAQSALNVLWKDMLPCLGKNNHPWESMLSSSNQK